MSLRPGVPDVGVDVSRASPVPTTGVRGLQDHSAEEFEERIAQGEIAVRMADRRLKMLNQALHGRNSLRGRNRKSRARVKAEYEKVWDERERTIAGLRLDKRRAKQAAEREEEAQEQQEDLAEREHLAPLLKASLLKEKNDPEDVRNAIQAYTTSDELSDDDVIQMARSGRLAKERRTKELERRRKVVEGIEKEEQKAADLAADAEEVQRFAETTLKHDLSREETASVERLARRVGGGHGTVAEAKADIRAMVRAERSEEVSAEQARKTERSEKRQDEGDRQGAMKDALSFADEEISDLMTGVGTDVSRADALKQIRESNPASIEAAQDRAYNRWLSVHGKSATEEEKDDAWNTITTEIR